LIHFYKRFIMVKKGKTPQKEDVESEAVEEAPTEAPAPAVEEVAETIAVEEPAVIDAPVNKKKKAAAAAEKENGASEEASPPVVNGDGDASKETTGDKKTEEKDEKKKTPKPEKRVVPSWASLTDEARKNLSKSKLPKPKVQDAVLAAMSACADSKGLVSAGAIRKFVMEENPDLPKMVLKKTVAKAVERGLIKQVKGKGFIGAFKLESAKSVAKAAKPSKAKGAKAAKAVGPKLPPLENEFPLVFTWACNPKEASVPFIRKYLTKHYPELNVAENPIPFRKALENGEAKGQLKRVTGQGFSGSLALIDGADKSGGKFEDPIENAIIAMSEPKQVSVNSLRDYLGEYHKEYNTDNRPKVLKNALDRGVAKGWLKQISGKGFIGTYRLMHPYFPAPKELWGDHFVEKKEKEEVKAEKSTPKRKATKRAAVDSESEEESEDDDGGEVMPTPKKRGAPTARKNAAPAKKVAKKVVAAKKSKPAPKKGKKKAKK